MLELFGTSEIENLPLCLYYTSSTGAGHILPPSNNMCPLQFPDSVGTENPK